MNQNRSWIATALRLGAGAALAWGTVLALLAPEVSALAKIIAIAIVVATAWNPAAGLMAVVAMSPAGLLTASAPVLAAELFAWSFLATWLLCVWRPLNTTSTSLARNHSLVPVTLYAGCAIASWIGYGIAHAQGIDGLMLPALLARTIPPDHIVFSSPEPETWTMVAAVTGLALFAATSTLTRERASIRREVAMCVVAATAVLAVITLADVRRQWAFVGYQGSYLLRYVYGERFSAHLADLNAAGSQYVLGGLIALSMAVGERGRRRWPWIAALVVMLPALWLSGSRSASLGALIAGAGVIPWTRYRISSSVARAATVVVIVVVLALAGAAVRAAQPTAGQGTASNALALRSQFLITSARMFASAPMFGVGIGHYHERSNEFMPLALREVYRNENAHNYFAQQFAELGLVGGVLFVWLVVAVVRRGWRAAKGSGGSDAVTLGLFAASVGYLITCVTGHPLLVPEAALPFWAVFGALDGSASSADAGTGAPNRVRRYVAAAFAALIALGLVMQVRAWSIAATAPGERGFYGLETSSDGRRFTWMTRHGVFFAAPQPGVLTIPVRPPDEATDRPYVVAIEVGGHRVGTYDLVPGQWTNVQLPLRDRPTTPFRRIDLRANQTWTRSRELGGDNGPRSVMVGEVKWQAAGGH